MSPNQSLSVAERAANPAQSSESSGTRFHLSEVEQPLDDFEGSAFETCKCTGTSPVDQTVQVG